MTRDELIDKIISLRINNDPYYGKHYLELLTTKELELSLQYLLDGNIP